MNSTKRLTRGALTCAIALAFATPAFAQSSGSPGGDSGGQTKAGATATTGTTSGTTSNAKNQAQSQPRTSHTTKSSSDFNSWAKDHATGHQGRISRQAYLDEMGRRWDTMDKSNQGLTPAEVSRLTGKVDVDHAALPRTGSDVQAGNMGPSSVKGK